MSFEIQISSEAEEDIKALKKSEPQAFRKLEKLLVELMDHPNIGTGKPERLKHSSGIIYSRRITDKHRLVYSIHEEEIVVLVISAYGHYNDK